MKHVTLQYLIVEVSNSWGGLVKLVKILKKRKSFLVKTLTITKAEPTEVEWVVKFVKNWNLPLPPPLTIRYGRIFRHVITHL